MVLLLIEKCIKNENNKKKWVEQLIDLKTNVIVISFKNEEWKHITSNIVNSWDDSFFSLIDTTNQKYTFIFDNVNVKKDSKLWKFIKYESRHFQNVHMFMLSSYIPSVFKIINDIILFPSHGQYIHRFFRNIDKNIDFNAPIFISLKKERYQNVLSISEFNKKKIEF